MRSAAATTSGTSRDSNFVRSKAESGAEMSMAATTRPSRSRTGAAMAFGEPIPSPFVGGTTTFTWTLSASTQIEVVWPLGPIELGLTTDVGYQRGIVEQNSFGAAGLAGVFASLGASLGWTP